MFDTSFFMLTVLSVYSQFTNCAPSCVPDEHFFADTVALWTY